MFFKNRGVPKTRKKPRETAVTAKPFLITKCHVKCLNETEFFTEKIHLLELEPLGRLLCSTNGHKRGVGESHTTENRALVDFLGQKLVWNAKCPS